MSLRLALKNLLLALLLAAPFAAFAAETELTWYGHAAFKIITPSGKVILIDPWISNPTNKNAKEDLAKMNKVDLILITHGHFDHVGDSVEIARKTGARLVSTFDLGKALVQYGGFPENQMGMDTQGNFGGELSLLQGEVQIAFIPAIHSSSVTEPKGLKHVHDGGNPGGFLITVKDGPAIYHTGDTDVFSDMTLIKQFHKVNVMLTAIGGHFTMGPQRAAAAIKLVDPDMVIPMHFGTFPILDGTPQALDQILQAEQSRTKLKRLMPGESIKL